jgi:hypothetical protein
MAKHTISGPGMETPIQVAEPPRAKANGSHYSPANAAHNPAGHSALDPVNHAGRHNGHGVYTANGDAHQHGTGAVNPVTSTPSPEQVNTSPDDTRRRPGRPRGSRNRATTAKSIVEKALTVPVSMTMGDSEYTELEWMNPTANDTGQSVRLWARVTPEMERAIQVCVSSGKFPYCTPDDLIRHAVYRHLYWLHQLESVQKHALLALESLSALYRDDTYRVQVAERVEAMLRHCMEHLERGFVGEAARLAQDVRAIVDSVPTSLRRQQLDEMLAKAAARIRTELEKRGTGAGNAVATLPAGKATPQPARAARLTKVKQ